jgi:hypothetical protein
MSHTTLELQWFESAERVNLLDSRAYVYYKGGVTAPGGLRRTTDEEEIQMTPLDEPAGTVPKTAQITQGQWTELDALARELHYARTVRGSRITSNTLIRVAISGLLAHEGHLHGNNEDELLASWLEFLQAREVGSGEANQTG